MRPEIKVDIKRTDQYKDIEQLLTLRRKEGWELEHFTSSNASVHTFVFKRRTRWFKQLLWWKK
jgi:hypothetical protein